MGEAQERNVPPAGAISLDTSETRDDGDTITLDTLLDVLGAKTIDQRTALLRSIKMGRPDLTRELARHGFSMGFWWNNASRRTLKDRMSELDCLFLDDNAPSSEDRVAALEHLVQAFAICPQDLLVTGHGLILCRFTPDHRPILSLF